MMTEDPTLVFVTQMFPPEKGGNASRIHDLAVNLEDDGWNVVVLAPPPTIPAKEYERTWERMNSSKVGSVNVYRLWTWQPRVENPGLLRRLPYYLLFGIHAMFWLLVHKDQTDLVVTTTPPISTGAPGLVISRMGVPWVVDVRDMWIDASISLGYLRQGSIIERISRGYQRMVFNRCDLITVTTETLASGIRDRYSAKHDKVAVIPNGVDTSLFSPADEATDEPNDKNWENFEYSIVYTGNLGSAQDLETCIRSMQYLEHDNATLALIGGGNIETELRKLAREAGVEDRVQFYDPKPRTEIPKLLRSADIGLAPLKNIDSLSYAMPTKVYEYLACCLPTVAMGNGEITRFMDRSNGGICVPNDPEKLADSIDELLKNRSRRQQMGEQGQAFVDPTYDRSNIANRLSGELTELLSDSAPC